MKRPSIASALVSVTAIPLLALSGCSTMPEQIDELDQARATVHRLENEPMAQAAAAEELGEARDALARAEADLDNGQPVATVRHEAYLARRHAEIGLQMTSEAEAQASIADAEAKRTRVQLMAREAEANRAQRLAERSQQAAELSQRRAERSQAVAEAAVDESRRMADELAEMKAEETERGLVLTLGDVLFDTNGAELKAGATIAMDRLANFLKDNPKRRILIEGHTDARGSDEYNTGLSSRRARAVSEALMQYGIAGDRLRTAGLGEAYPVASNDTEAGMQQNRRVEIVISDKTGSFPDAAEQRAAFRSSARP